MSLALQVTLALVAVAVYLIYRYFTETFDYWKTKGVVFVKPYFLVGSMKSVLLIQEHLGEFIDRLYRNYNTERYVGYYMGKKPTLLVRDPELIKHIMIKDFAHFTDHGFDIHEEADPLQAKNLFNLEGKRWKDMRSKLVPTFTSGKMKNMLPLMQEVAAEFDTKLKELADKKEQFEFRRVVSCFFTDIVGTCIFGIKCNSIKDPEVEFRKVSRSISELSLVGAMKAMAIFLVPELARHLRFGLIDTKVTNFFRKLVKDMMEMRKASGTTRRDFMQLLIELKEKGKITVDKDDLHEVKDEETNSADTTLNLSHDDLTAQATVFFLAGFDTSSSATSYACWELAAHPEVQERMQHEIDEVLCNHDDKVTYEALKEMKYLDCIINETMRLHPVVLNHIRKCNKKYQIPGSDLEIDEGVMISIPISAMHRDPDFYDDADQFLPERFLDEDLVQKNQFIFTPFGIGPRQCIGNRFAMLQTKLCLVTILRNFSLNKGSKTKEPLRLDRKQFISSVEGGVWVTLVPRNEE